MAAALGGRRRQSPRFYDGAQVDIDSAAGSSGHRWLLVPRNRRTGEFAFYRCYSGHPVPLTTLVEVAGRRWTVEETFQAAKGLAGLDEHQVRRWTSWRRWITLAMLAHAFLAVTAAVERAGATPPPELAPLTCSEIRQLFAAFITPPAASRTSSADRTGDDDTKPVPAPATTSDRPSNNRDQDLQLEY